MQPLLPLLTTLLPVLYGLSAAGYARVYIAEPGVFEGTRGQSGGPMLLRAGVFVHILYLAARGLMEGHLPLASVYDFLSATGFSLAVVYLYVEMRVRIRTTGIFVVPLVFFLQILASAYGTASLAIKPPIKPIWFELHTLAAVLGYSAFVVSAIYGVLFLILYRDIKANRVSLFYSRMPPLETLGRMNASAASAGLVLLALAIAMGMGWARLTGVRFLSDPKTWLTVVAWGILAFAVLAYHRLGWRGPRAVYASLAGFATLVLSRFAVDLFFHSFHTFR
jgi:HemX protein